MKNLEIWYTLRITVMTKLETGRYPYIEPDSSVVTYECEFGHHTYISVTRLSRVPNYKRCNTCGHPATRSMGMPENYTVQSSRMKPQQSASVRFLAP